MKNNGKQGEQLFAQIMQQKGYIVEDVSNNPEYWYRDIDFIVTSSTSGETKTFEVKWDSKISNTGNLYLELTSLYSKGGRGWFEFCEADYLAYGDAVTKVFYIIDMEQLRQAANNLPFRSARCGNDSIGQLVALKDIQAITQIL